MYFGVCFDLKYFKKYSCLANMNLYEETLVFEVGLFWDSMLMAFISLLVYQQFLLHSRGSDSKANLCECLPVSGGQDGARAGVNGQGGERRKEWDRERERERERERGSSTAVTWMSPSPHTSGVREQARACQRPTFPKYDSRPLSVLPLVGLQRA